MEFIKVPYLPRTRVTVAVGDCEVEGVRIIKPYYAQNLPMSLRRHADLTFCYLGNALCVVAPESYDYYKKAFEGTKLRIVKGAKTLDMHYPDDAAYNIAIVGDKIFCREAITDSVLLDTAAQAGYSITDMKQGYGKCSVCPVDEKSAISADKSFYKAAQKNGIDVLCVTNDTILLPGYDNGFFGGSAYMTDAFTLVTNGEIETHPDCERVRAFLKKRGKNIVSGKRGQLSDFGSFIPVMEE